MTKMTKKYTSDKNSITSMSEEDQLALIKEATAIIKVKKERQSLRSTQSKPGGKTPEFLDYFKNYQLLSFAVGEEAPDAEYQLLKASIDFYAAYGQEYLDYVGFYPLLVSAKVSKEGQYYRAQFEHSDILLDNWVQNAEADGLVYYRLTTFGKWFMTTPEANFADIRALLSQYKRGETMDHMLV